MTRRAGALLPVLLLLAGCGAIQQAFVGETPEQTFRKTVANYVVVLEEYNAFNAAAPTAIDRGTKRDIALAIIAASEAIDQADLAMAACGEGDPVTCDQAKILAGTRLARMALLKITTAMAVSGGT